MTDVAFPPAVHKAKILHPVSFGKVVWVETDVGGYLEVSSLST